MKKLLTLILSLLLVAGVFAGCGGTDVSYEDNGDAVTLKMVVPFSSQKDLSLVQDEINKLLETKLPNTQLELICDDAMGDKWNLWIGGKTSFDIAHTGFAVDLPDNISKKSFLPLNDLIDQYAPTIKEERDEKYTQLYWTGMYNGETYAIPAVQSYVDKTRCVVVTSSASQYLDIDALMAATHGKPHIGDEVYQIVDKWLQDTTAAGIHAEIYATYQWENCPAKIGYVFVGGLNSNICYDPFAEEFKMLDWHETEEFKSYSKWMSKWYKEGFINKDVMAGGVPKQGDGNASLWIGANTDGINLLDGDVYNSNASTYIRIQSDDMKISASHDIGALQTYLSIPATAKNPVRAMKFLELIRTQEGAEILNMLAFGIEGTHYEKLSDSYIKAFDYEGQGSSSSKYGIPSWMLGNMLNGMYTISPQKENIVEWANEYYTEKLPNQKKHVLYGFSFDLSSLNIPMTNIRSANAELESQIGYGVAPDTEKAIENLTNNLKKAGIDNVLETLQKQAEEYIAANKADK